MDPLLEQLREDFPLWSQRTQARYAAALRRLRVLGASLEDLDAIFERCKRRNGTLRVDRLLRWSEWLETQS